LCTLFLKDDVLSPEIFWKGFWGVSVFILEFPATEILLQRQRVVSKKVLFHVFMPAVQHAVMINKPPSSFVGGCSPASWT